MNTHEETFHKFTLSHILEFETKYGRNATEDAIFWGAFTSSFDALEFIHPSDYVRTNTPDWIINAFIRTVA